MSGDLLSFAGSSGLIDDGTQGQPRASNDNDVLLANLRRLYAIRNTNGEKIGPKDQFSRTQPMGQQLSMVHQKMAQSGSRNLPFSMTQPLPMETLQLGVQRGGVHNMAQGVDEVNQWNLGPPSSPYSNISPYGTYQQFSPLPHPQMNHLAQPQTYHNYPFSATVPDLSNALRMSSYNSNTHQPSFSNTVNMGQMLPDKAGMHSLGHTSSSSTSTLINPNWPPTSSEVPSVIDKELFGFGLDSNDHRDVYRGYLPQSQMQQASDNYSSSGSRSGSSKGGKRPKPTSSEDDIERYMREKYGSKRRVDHRSKANVSKE